MNDNLVTRRDVLATGMAGAAAMLAGAAVGAEAEKLIWGNLIQISMDMWADRPVSSWGRLQKEDLHYVTTAPVMRFDDSLWNDIIKRMADQGFNLIVLDLGDAIKYESHPEIALKDAWSIARLKEELDKLRKLGLEPIPKLNFSTAHDQWLGDYSRMVSTPKYYTVCEELIAEVIGLFGRPRFFHIGYDEETLSNQAQYALAIIRQHELWWHDFDFFVKTIENRGVRPWMWADYAWHYPKDYFERVPKTVLQSNWYYGMAFDPAKEVAARTYLDLDKVGFEQVPTASNWSTPENFRATVEFARKNISLQRLKGFLQTPWMPTVEKFRGHHMEAIDVVGKVIAARL